MEFTHYHKNNNDNENDTVGGEDKANHASPRLQEENPRTQMDYS